MDSFDLASTKTKEAAQVFSNLKVTPKANNRIHNVLLVLDKVDKNAKLALRNINFLKFNCAKDTNAYEALVAQKLIITKRGLEELTKKLKK